MFYYQKPARGDLLFKCEYVFKEDTNRFAPRLQTNRNFKSTFEAKIRRLVKLRLAWKNNSNEIVKVITDKKEPILMKVLSGLVLFLCAVFFLYQFVGRIQHYLSEPYAVDVFSRPTIGGNKVSLTFCLPETNGLLKLKEEYSLDIDHIQCQNSLLAFLKATNITRVPIDLEELWELTKISDMEIVTTTFCPADNSGARCPQEDDTVALTITDVMALVGKNRRLDAIILKDTSSLNYNVSIAKTVDKGCSSAALVISLEEYGMPLDSAKIYFLFLGSITRAHVNFKYYQFLNRRASPCVDITKYYDCVEHCRLKNYKKLPCRLPFISPQSLLPMCNISSKDTWVVYSDALNLIRNSVNDPSCKCPNPCTLLSTNMELHHVGEHPTHTVALFNFDTTSFVNVAEKEIYDVVNLFADTGGLLGLSLGLSILSLVQFVQSFTTTIVKHFKGRQIRRDPVYKKIDVVFGKMTTFENGDAGQCFLSQDHPILLKALWVTLWSVSLAAVSLFIHNRVLFYRSYPSRIVLKAERPNEVEFPLIVDCGESQMVIKILKKLSKKKKQPFCSFDMYDILDLGFLTASKLWNYSSSYPEFVDGRAIVKQFGGIDTLEPEGKSSLDTPVGGCVQFNVGTHKFSGSATLFVALKKIEEDKMVADCGRDYRTVSFLPRDEGVLDLRTNAMYGQKWRLANFFKHQKVEYWNNPKRPCVARAEFLECRNDCADRKLKPVINCSLPFIPVTLPECTNSRDARANRDAYLDVISGLNPVKDCGCIRSCTEIIYTSTEFTDPIDVGFSMAFFLFDSNIVETLVEERIYTLSAFLCDVGGNLGMMLGFSLLWILQLITFCVKIFACKKKSR